ncbi:hypothetical protein B0H67DRAFT_560164 [Lasiosphaeris hirsuta]|uniref:Secreted protein n=1 Tax=Lasiosphaeris hirsuta TaxID=260670 RepID=A0AA40B930_9PEZI|nr:hypothetical protein B0H67DRAFT_560164 [Lasiosphaeris hirsuta]
MMLSAWRIVLNRWAMIIVVRYRAVSSMADCTAASDLESNAEVAASSNRIDGFLINVLAMAIRCSWPPESWTPFCPT